MQSFHLLHIADKGSLIFLDFEDLDQHRVLYLKRGEKLKYLS